MGSRKENQGDVRTSTRRDQREVEVTLDWEVGVGWRKTGGGSEGGTKPGGWGGVAPDQGWGWIGA